MLRINILATGLHKFNDVRKVVTDIFPEDAPAERKNSFRGKLAEFGIADGEKRCSFCSIIVPVSWS